MELMGGNVRDKAVTFSSLLRRGTPISLLCLTYEGIFTVLGFCGFSGLDHDQ